MIKGSKRKPAGNSTNFMQPSSSQVGLSFGTFVRQYVDKCTSSPASVYSKALEPSKLQQALTAMVSFTSMGSKGFQVPAIVWRGDIARQGTIPPHDST
jgi:hypothetical protein